MKTPSLLAAGFPWLSAKLSLLLTIPLLLGPASVSTLPNSGAPFTFNNTGPLNTARYLHTATLLPNGKVLVAGGQNGGGFLVSSELYDPAAGTWAATTGPLNTARYAHTATLLPNGKVLVAGGQNGGGYLGSSELYDPAAGTWAPTTGPLNTA